MLKGLFSLQGRYRILHQTWFAFFLTFDDKFKMPEKEDKKKLVFVFNQSYVVFYARKVVGDQDLLKASGSSKIMRIRDPHHLKINKKAKQVVRILSFLWGEFFYIIYLGTYSKGIPL